MRRVQTGMNRVLTFVIVISVLCLAGLTVFLALSGNAKEDMAEAAPLWEDIDSDRKTGMTSRKDLEEPTDNAGERPVVETGADYSDTVPDSSDSQTQDNAEEETEEGSEIESVSTSSPGNVLICIDPGHYAGKNAVDAEDSYGYEENIATLRTGLRLREILAERYGIDSVMTRETEHISIGGYTNADLDSSHISLRGKSAEGCDLFVSLHTNSNRDNINGYPTFNQPLAINKPVVIVSLYAAGDERAVAAANAVGLGLSRIYENEGLCTASGFDTAQVNQVREWSMDYNDGLNYRGAVCVRHGKNGEYYGVLRGATEVGVPGIIIEHGFHSVAEIRREVMEGTLIEQWASADADGIAAAFGFY